MSKKVFDQIAEGLQEALSVVRGESMTADMLIAYELKHGCIAIGQTVTFPNGFKMTRVPFKT